MNTGTPAAATPASNNDVRLPLRRVPDNANCNGSSAGANSPAKRPADGLMSRRPTSTTTNTVSALSVVCMGLIDHRLSVTHKIPASSTG